MNKLKLYENEFGFYIDYIFSDNDIKKCLRLSEDDDYFSFSIFFISRLSVASRNNT